MVSSTMISKALVQEYELELLEEVRKATNHDREWLCNDSTIGSYNHYHLSQKGIPSGNQRWYGLVYLVYT